MPDFQIPPEDARPPLVAEAGFYRIFQETRPMIHEAQFWITHFGETVYFLNGRDGARITATFAHLSTLGGTQAEDYIAGVIDGITHCQLGHRPLVGVPDPSPVEAPGGESVTAENAGASGAEDPTGEAAGASHYKVREVEPE